MHGESQIPANGKGFMSRKSSSIALGGVFSALCLVLMFMTGLVPFATYMLPALAGAMLCAVVVENGSKVALMVYASVSILSLFIVPDREASMIFICFFGYYPILKEQLERLPARALEYAVKFALFNLAIVGGYLILSLITGIPLLSEEMFGEWGQYSAIGMLLAGNVVFALYDIAVTRYLSLYIRWFRPRFLRK